MKILNYLDITLKLLLLISIIYLGAVLSVSKNPDKKEPIITKEVR